MQEQIEMRQSEQPISRQFSKKDQEAIEELIAKFGVGSKEVEDYIAVVEKEEAKKELKKNFEKNELLNQIDETLRLIDSVKLIKANKKEEKVLESQKNKAKELIEKCLKSAQKYTAAVEDLSQTTTLAKKIFDTKIYQEKVSLSDLRRRQAHQALIDDINIALRYINEHFAYFSDEILDELAEKFEKRKEKFIKVNRVKFPFNVFLPEKMNLKNRDDIGKWAVLVTEELAKFRQLSNH